MVALPTLCPVCDADGELEWDDGVLLCQACGHDVSELIPRRPSRNGHGPGPPHQLGTRALELAKLRPVEWLWQGRLVRGVLNLLTGEEGVGKGTLLAWLIRRVTRGELPGALHEQPARVLWIGDEDPWERVVGPRLYAAGADLSLVRELTTGEESALLDVVRDASTLDALLGRERYELVAFEALVDNLPHLRNPTDMVEIRSSLRPLRRVLRHHEVTGLGTLHTTKVETGDFRRKQGGSHQFNALSRSSLFIGRHPDGSDRRVLARGKGNYGPPPDPLSFAIDARCFQLNDHTFAESKATDFREEPELTLEELVRGPHRQDVGAAPKRDALREPLLAALSHRPQGVRTLAELVGGTRATTTAALEELKRDGLAEVTPKGWLAGRSYREDRPATQDGEVAALFGQEPEHLPPEDWEPYRTPATDDDDPEETT
jgi:AAA domain